MRFSADTVANALAWSILAGLIVAAAVLTAVLGFLGLLILGLATCLVCVRAELDQDTPTWSVEVFRAKMARASSPEQRASMLEEGRAFMSPLRFYRRCGAVLAVVGLAGLVWQLARPVGVSP